MSPEVLEHVSTPEGTELEKKKKKLPQFKKKYLTSTLRFGLMAVGGLKGYNLFFIEEPLVALTGTATYGVLGTSIEGSGSTSSVLTQSVSVASTSEVLGVYVTPGDEILEGQLLYIQDDSELDDRIEAFYEVIEGHNDTINNISTYKDIADYKVDIQDYYEDIKDVEGERSDFEVYSEISGKVITVNVREGFSPNAAQAAVVIYNMDTMELTANVDELDMEHVSMGMDVNLSYSTGGSNQNFTGYVSAMSYEATNDNGVAYFPIVIAVESEGAISSGVNVSYAISVGDTEEGYLVPVDALKQNPQGTCVYIQGTAPTGTTSVTVEEGAKPEGYYAQLVEISTSNSSYALIREGLTEGMTVFTPYQTTAPMVAQPVPMPVESPIWTL